MSVKGCVRQIEISNAQGFGFMPVCVLGGIAIGYVYRRFILPRGSALSAGQFGIAVIGTLMVSLVLNFADVWFFAGRIKGDGAWLWGWTPFIWWGSIIGFKLAYRAPTDVFNEPTDEDHETQLLTLVSEDQKSSLETKVSNDA